ncbi:MAG: hypothetical protein BMS9Abin01_1972 [Gammaproteobacteria bacterium]|nr:MAG: hypothetical protein BMS9Abin01_1972 [Gammaproteobacteria bacterium]
MGRRRFLIGSAALAAGALVSTPAAARRLFPAGVTDRYVAWQGERMIGRQQFSFRRAPGRFLVDAQVDMRFELPVKGVVSYSHESREVWDTGWLQRLDSRTRIDGRIQEVRAERNGGALMVDSSAVGSFQVSTYLVPSNLWHRDSRLVDAFIDVENGSIRFVRPRYVGKQTLQQSGGTVEAHRYSIRGQLDREAWYDADCVLVRWDLPLEDGAWINFRREMS